MNSPRIAVKRQHSINSTATVAVLTLFFKNPADANTVMEQERSSIHGSFELLSSEPKLCSTGNVQLQFKSADPTVVAAFKNSGARIMPDSQAYLDAMARRAVPQS